MRNFKRMMDARKSKKASICHLCGGRQDRGRMSLKKKANKLVVGRYYGPSWFGYPDLSRLGRSR